MKILLRCAKKHGYWCFQYKAKLTNHICQHTVHGHYHNSRQEIQRPSKAFYLIKSSYPRFICMTLYKKNWTIRFIVYPNTHRDTCACTTNHRRKLESNLWVLSLSFNNKGPEYGTELLSLESKYVCHLAL